MTPQVFALQMQTFAADASPDELELIATAAQRVHDARGIYGALDLGKDGRDFEMEAAAEAVDGFLYSVMALMRKERA